MLADVCYDQSAPSRVAPRRRDRSRMTALARLAGQLLSVGFDGTAAGAELRARIAASEIGGVMLFRPEHLRRPGQLAALVADAAGGGPGRLAAAGFDRPGGGPGAAPARAGDRLAADAVGRERRATSARTTAVGRALGEELAAVGVGWNFAPVLDVHTNPGNPVIGNRAFGTDAGGRRPPGAGVLARAAGRGAGRLRQALSPATATRGPTRTSSCPSSRTTPSACARVELAPFAAAARGRPGGVHDRARAVPGAGSRSAGDAVAPDRDRPAARRARLSRRAGVRRSRHEGGRRPLSDRGAGGRRDRGGLRSPAGARAGRAPAGGVRGDRPRRRGAQRRARARRGERRPRRGAQGRLHRRRCPRRRRCSRRCSAPPPTRRWRARCAAVDPASAVAKSPVAFVRSPLPKFAGPVSRGRGS